MNLYLVRHASAADKADDPERHLTASGKRDAENLARFLCFRRALSGRHRDVA